MSCCTTLPHLLQFAAAAAAVAAAVAAAAAAAVTFISKINENFQLL